MPAFINIELYLLLNNLKKVDIDIALSKAETKGELKANKSENEHPIYIFEAIPNLKFFNYRRTIELKENWYAVEFCIEYENVLNQESRQTVFKGGIKNAFLKILKLLNQYFESPVILITNEISNGFYFEHKFGNNSNEFAEFELGLIKKEHVKIIDIRKYKLIEETENYHIYIQDNEYVKWD